MTSTRLPGKVLLDLSGKPVLQHIVERISRSRYIDAVVVATTRNVEDEPIVKMCKKIKCQYYRGSEDDVLLRVLEAAESMKADIIVEITGDCPVVDWRHIDKLVELFFSGDYDYVSNILKRSFPDGFDVQVFPVSVLAEVNKLTKCPENREHVSLYIYSNPDKYRLFNWEANIDMNYPEMAVTLDTEEDYELLKIVYDNLYYKNYDFSAKDVVDFLLNQIDLLMINKNIIRKIPYQVHE